MELRDRHDMTYKGNALGQKAPGQGVPVRAPLPHEGVGDALRRAYVPRASDLPADMLDLLAKLS